MSVDVVSASVVVEYLLPELLHLLLSIVVLSLHHAERREKLAILAALEPDKRTGFYYWPNSDGHVDDQSFQHVHSPREFQRPLLRPEAGQDDLRPMPSDQRRLSDVVVFL